MSDARARTPDPAERERDGSARPQDARRAGEPAPGDDAAALAENVDLDAEARRRILEAHRSLDRVDHYEALGVEPTADGKALKRAYYQLATVFHPDRYFRKNLGSFKPRMEAVFGRLTLAYETLSDADRRREYDAYLEEQRRVLGIERMLADALAEARRAEEKIEREVGAHPSLQPDAAPSAPPPAVDLASRRDALARRLLGGRGPGAGSTSPPPAAAPSGQPPAPSVADAMQALRRRYEERVLRAKAAQARKYTVNGEAALAAGDSVAAANAFRVALSLTPGDPELERVAREAQSKADEVLGEAYARQAAYEEKNGQWPEAARSWVRACRARPNDPGTHERAAHALTKAAGDLHEAARLAAHACALDPSNARYRVALAQVYLAAGLALNARREIETAAQLAPHDVTIQAMLKRTGK